LSKSAKCQTWGGLNVLKILKICVEKVNGGEQAHNVKIACNFGQFSQLQMGLHSHPLIHIALIYRQVWAINILYHNNPMF